MGRRSVAAVCHYDCRSETRCCAPRRRWASAGYRRPQSRLRGPCRMAGPFQLTPGSSRAKSRDQFSLSPIRRRAELILRLRATRAWRSAQDDGAFLAKLRFALNKIGNEVASAISFPNGVWERGKKKFSVASVPPREILPLPCSDVIRLAATFPLRGESLVDMSTPSHAVRVRRASRGKAKLRQAAGKLPSPRALLRPVANQLLFRQHLYVE